MTSVLKLAAVSLLMTAAAIPAAQAQQYPDKPVRIQLGFAAGGGADILARWYADRLTKLSGGTFIIENKVGASGNIALDAAAKAKPDGATLLFASTVTTAGNAAVFKQMPLDVTKDLLPIVGFAETPFVLCVAPDSPIKTVADLNALIKQKAGKATYGSATTSALASTALYLQKIGVDATHVGYKVTADAIRDVTGGQIDFAFADVIFAMGQAKQNRIRILAIASDGRSPGLPDVPSLKELNGATTGDIVALWGIWAPTGTPKAVTDKLEAWTNEITKTDETQKFLISTGATPWVSNQAEYKKKFDVAVKAWAEAAQLAKIEAQ